MELNGRKVMGLNGELLFTFNDYVFYLQMSVISDVNYFCY